jgi:nanoRNase/pAp phosphatase (c-di-AMP/oligoRNAs hydrolase)
MTNEQSKNLILALQNQSKLLIIIKGSPDPDVIASSFALKLIAKSFNVESDIVAFNQTSLPQNRALIKKLDIPVEYKSTINAEGYSGYAVLDHQTAVVEQIGTMLSCIIHIDHHTPEEDKVVPKFKLLSEHTGAVSTLIAEFIILNPDIMFSEKDKTRLATALYYGIKIDTDSFSNALDRDIAAAAWLEEFLDQSIINGIETIPFSDETMTVITKAIMNRVIYKDVLICGVGFMPEYIRDSIAIAADYLLENESYFMVIVFACIQKSHSQGLYLDASVRTADRGYDLNNFIKDITPDGGARAFKGAFQVDLNFFSQNPGKPLFWDMIVETTLQRIIVSYEKHPPTSIKSFFMRIRSRIKRLFETF